MPNWVEGILKVRGKQKDIINFIENGLTLQKNIYYEYGKSKLKGIKPKAELDNEYIIIKNSKEGDYIYINETSRHFADTADEISTTYILNGICILLLDFSAAWSIDTEELADISKKYNIDLKIYGFESGRRI